MIYILAQVVKMLIEPANLFSLLLVLGGFAAVSHDERWQKFGRRLCFALSLLLFLIAVLPVGRWLLLPLENRFPPSIPDRVDGIVLLAGDENPFLTEARHQASFVVSARRFIGFAVLAREYPKARLAFVGGSNEILQLGKLTNEDVAKMALKDLGIPPDRR